MANRKNRLSDLAPRSRLEQRGRRQRRPHGEEIMSSATRSTVTLHVVSSLDGFIAKQDNSISWMDSPGDVYERGVTDDGAFDDSTGPIG